MDLEDWPDGQLTLEVANLLSRPAYIVMTDAERELESYPVSRDERITFIRAWGLNG